MRVLFVILVLLLVTVGAWYASQEWGHHRPPCVWGRRFTPTNSTALVGRWVESGMYIDLRSNHTCSAYLRSCLGTDPGTHGSWRLVGSRVILSPASSFQWLAPLECLTLTNRLFLVESETHSWACYQKYGVTGWTCLSNAGPARGEFQQ